MKNWNNLLRAALGALFTMFLISSSAFAQMGTVSRYSVSSETGTWIDATSGGTRLGGYDDNTWSFSLPFDINYDSTTVGAGTTIAMSDDGDFSFRNFSGGYSYCTVELGSSQYPGCIGAFNIDWDYASQSPRGNYWSVTGSSPNRILTMEWYENSIYCCSPTTSFELQIHETSGVIEILYADHSLSTGTSDCGHGAYVGLNGMTSPTSDYIIAESNVTSTPSTDLKFTPPTNAAPQLSLIPKSINFGTLPLNDTETYCVTAYSVGNRTLAINNYYILGDTNFSVESGPSIGDSVAVGSSVQFCIHFIARPSNHSANFVVVTNGKDSGTQVVALTGGGATPLATYTPSALFHRVHTMLRDTSAPQYVYVTNTGAAPLTFNSIYFIGLNPDSYFITHTPQNPLPPDATDSIGVGFSPSLEGLPDAKLVISSNAFNKPYDTVSLFGIGSLPHLVITVPAPGSGNMVMFDSVAVGDSVCQTIQLANVGTDTLQIRKQIVTYGDYDFSFYPLSGTDTTIVPGGTKLVNICFKPLKVGTRIASIRFYTNIPLTFEKPSRDTSQFVINVTGIGVPFGQLVVMGSLVDTAIVGQTNCISDTLMNRGQSVLTVDSLRMTPATSHFALSGATMPLVLQPGQRQIVSLCFKPAARGNEFDTLTFAGTTSDKTINQPVFLQGVGVVQCVSVDSMVTFGTNSMTMVGSQDSTCITVTNCGDLPATYTAEAPKGTGYTLISASTSGVIAPDSTAMFCVRFVPTAIGAANGTITITGGPTAQTVVLGGVGAGVTASATGQPSAPVSIDTCNTFTVTITNNGNVAWTPGTGTIGGTNAADFTIVSGPTPATIAPGGTATVTINFCPKTIGSESMTLTFPSSSPKPVTAFSFSTNGIGSASGVTLRTEEAGFSLGQTYPNPTTGDAAIALTLPYDAPIRIDLIDATGALVKTAYQGNLSQGNQMVNISAKGLPSGTYFYQLSSGDVRLTRQMSVVK